jgi:hypothetical protein
MQTNISEEQLIYPIHEQKNSTDQVGFDPKTPCMIYRVILDDIPDRSNMVS